MFKKGHPKYPNRLEIHISKEQLLDLYYSQNKRATEIAKLFNCKIKCIYSKMKKHNITLKGFPIDDNQLKELYVVKHKTIKQLARFFGCGTSTISRHLKNLSIKTRRGYKITPETREKQRLARLGKPNKSKGQKCPKLAGKNNPSWKGGVTPILHKIRTSFDYELWRKAVFERDNWTCQKCFKRGDNLEAHHIKSFKKFPELRFAIDNGRTLCKKCHVIIDKHRKVKNEC